jgi:hypothetical protein
MKTHTFIIFLFSIASAAAQSISTGTGFYIDATHIAESLDLELAPYGCCASRNRLPRSRPLPKCRMIRHNSRRAAF